MRSINRISVAVTALLCAGTFAATPAQAVEGAFNIMLVGSGIPAGVGSVRIESGRCVTDVQPGRDRNTGMTYYAFEGEDNSADFHLYGDTQCASVVKSTVRREIPYGTTTKNWWVSLS